MAAADGSSPVRAVSMDKRLKDMPDGLDTEQKNAFIRQACKLKDSMYDLVNVLEKKATGTLSTRSSTTTSSTRLTTSCWACALSSSASTTTSLTRR